MIFCHCEPEGRGPAIGGASSSIWTPRNDSALIIGTIKRYEFFRDLDPESVILG